MLRNVLTIAAVAALLATLPSVAASAQSKPTAAAPKPALTTPVNINTATATDLEGLPGLGAKTAARIVEYRQKNGPFKKVEELMNVRGLGEKNFLKLKPQLTVGAAKADHDRQDPR
jgi:competence protein ComEA